MSTGPDHSAELKFVVTNTLIVRDIKRSIAFYRDVLGATVLRDGEPAFLRHRYKNAAMSSGRRGARSSSPSPKSMQRRCGATCAIRTATLLRPDKRP
jgi:catechol 2,3-dioxygenase-like lactoylglutathione lyase family enzyme